MLIRPAFVLLLGLVGACASSGNRPEHLRGAAVDRPLMLGGLNADLADRAYLASRRVAVALRGHQPILAAIQAMEDCYQALAAGVDPKALERLASPALQQRARRQSDFDDCVARYLAAFD